MTARDVAVYIFDPPQAIPLRLDKGVNYGGILGYTFLSRYLTTIDYQKLRVRFDPLPAIGAGGAGPGTGGVHRVAFEVREGLIHAKGSINGSGPLRLVIDTGSAEVLVLPRVADALRLVANDMPNYPGVKLAHLSSVVLGDAQVTNVPAIVHSLEREPAFGLTYDGIVGYPFLSNFLVAINYRDRVLTLTEQGGKAGGR